VNGASNECAVSPKSRSVSALKRQHWVGANGAVGAGCETPESAGAGVLASVVWHHSREVVAKRSEF
jgi:hypothetical protein